MKKIVFSIGGSVLVPSLESNNIKKYSSALQEIAKIYQVFVVVGGGGEARRYINAARKLGIDETTSDELGIMITRINASLLMWALGDSAYPCIAENYSEVKQFAESKKIVIMGGVTPAQTTDAVSAVLAESLGADLLINVTSVDGIYSADPKKDTNAKKCDYLTPDELLSIIKDDRMVAGANNIIDLVAAKVVQRSRVPMLVLDGKNIEIISNALLNGTITGTVVSFDKNNPITR
ncbi:MAG: UMP kinase [Euryarchaeota archaeon]|nr:UMP kinase [Euryarchaeota archaeon]